MKNTIVYKNALRKPIDLFMPHSIGMKRLGIGGFLVTTQQDKVSYRIDRCKKAKSE